MIAMHIETARGACRADNDPHGQKTMSLLAAPRHAGPRGPCGAINGACVLACSEPALVPTLRAGDLVVTGNLAAHAVAGVRLRSPRMAEVLRLPPYSPDPNPTEQAFAKREARDAPLRRLPAPAPSVPPSAPTPRPRRP